MSETEPTPDFTSMRQVDFARERAAMCTADITDLAATLGSMLTSLYGDQIDNTALRATLTLAQEARSQMQRCRLLLVKHDLAEYSKAAIEAMSEAELAELDQLPPLPEETIFGFERPRMFHCANPYNPAETFTKGMSIIVPFDPGDLPFKSVRHEQFTGYLGYLRVVDQERIFVDEPQIESQFGTFDVHRELAAFRRNRELWLPALVNELDAAFDGTAVTIEYQLRLALARAAEQRATTLPASVQRAAETAGVGRRTRRSVQTIELSPDAPPLPRPASEPTGRTIGYEFDVGREWRYITDDDGNRVREYGHTRRLRAPDGTVTKEIWIKTYTKGKGKPRKPHTDAVTVARAPSNNPPPLREEGR